MHTGESTCAFTFFLPESDLLFLCCFSCFCLGQLRSTGSTEHIQTSVFATWMENVRATVKDQADASAILHDIDSFEGQIFGTITFEAARASDNAAVSSFNSATARTAVRRAGCV